METFRQNVEWNINQIAVQFRHAELVNGRARSGYYKVAIMLAASIVEALAYKILDGNGATGILEDWKCTKHNFLPKDYDNNANERLSICRRVRPEFKLDKTTDFKKVNDVCHKIGIFSDKTFRRVEKIRTLRNKIHLQGLSTLDRSYTKKELESVSSVINELLGKMLNVK